MDVWAAFSMVAGAATGLWDRLEALAGPLSPAHAVAFGCIAVSAALLVLSRFGRKAGPEPVLRTRIDDAYPRDPPSFVSPELQRNEAPWSSAPGLSAFRSEPYAQPRELKSLPPQRSANAGDGGLPVFQYQVPAVAEQRLPAVTLDPQGLIARLEARRGTRVIAIVHRDGMARGHLDAVDLEDALTAIRETPADQPLDIVLHSPGGMVRAAQQIARAVKAHKARTTVFVPYFALGSATLIAFAADEIAMSGHAAMSPVDPFVGVGPASSLLRAIKGKSAAKIDDATAIAADIARKLMDEARRVTCELMHQGHKNGLCRVTEEVVSGKWSRDRAITATVATELGLKVSLQVPGEVYELVRACRRAGERSSGFGEARAHDVEVRGGQEPQRDAAPVGLFDSSLEHVAELSRGRARPRAAAADLVWLAHSGGHVPPEAAERAQSIIQRIEYERHSRVICVVHGETTENAGFDFEDLEDVLTAIVASDPSTPLDIVLHTQGGSSFAGRQIARAIKNHRAPKTVFVPYFAMSAGSRIALAADQIVMGAQATLGPIDTQIYGWPSPSILHLATAKPKDAISDPFLILAEEARKLLEESRTTACELMKGTYPAHKALRIAEEMVGGRWTHGYPITAVEAKTLGLNVFQGMPDLFYDLVRCFRQADGEEPSVLYLPR